MLERYDSGKTISYISKTYEVPISTINYWINKRRKEKEKQNG
jgi:hypothetical protein